MRNKVLLTAITALLSSQVYAKISYCNYTDQFHLSATSAIQPLITGPLGVKGGVDVIQVNETSFNIVDKQPEVNSCTWSNRGTVTVTYALSKDDYCVLNITDGPAINTPIDTDTKCYGKLVYGGLSYDGIGTHSYSLLFTVNQ